MLKNKLNEAERQEKTRELEKKLVKELWPMLVGLKQRVDRRLVKTCLGLVMAIVLHRHRNHDRRVSVAAGDRAGGSVVGGRGTAAGDLG
jgi:hypothetical protein